jgi:hypothetical protein
MFENIWIIERSEGFLKENDYDFKNESNHLNFCFIGFKYEFHSLVGKGKTL